MGLKKKRAPFLRPVRKQLGVHTSHIIVLVDVISLPQVATCGHVLSTIKTWALLINWVTC